MSVSTSLTPEQIAELRKTIVARPAHQVTAQEFLRAVAIRWFSLGLDESMLKPFLRKQTAKRPELERLLGKPAYQRIIQSSKRASQSSSPAGAAANARRTAHLAVGRALSKMEKGTPNSVDQEGGSACGVLTTEPAQKLSASAQLRARVALAVVAQEQLSSIRSPRGWNTVSLSKSRMSLLTGWSTVTCLNALNELAELRLITDLGSRPGASRRVKISGRLSAAQKTVADDQYETIGRLMGRPDAVSTAADIFASVSHPAWNFGPKKLGHRAWLVAVADAAGIDPLELAVSKRHQGLARKALQEVRLDPKGDTDIFLAGLDTYAGEHGCFTARKEAEAAATERAENRAQEIAVYRQEKAETFSIVERVLGSSVMIPRLEDADRFETWIRHSAKKFAGCAFTFPMAEHVSREIARRVGKRTGKGDTNLDVAFWILAGAEVKDAPSERSARLAAGRVLDHAGAARASVPLAAAGRDELQTWGTCVVAALGRYCPEPPARVLIDELAARLAYRGHGDKAQAVASRIVGAASTRDVARTTTERMRIAEALNGVGADVLDIPLPTDLDAAGEWAEGVKRQFDGRDLSPSTARGAANELVARMQHRGYDLETAAATAEWVLGGVMTDAAA